MNDKVAAKVKEFFSQYPLRSYPKGHILIYANEDPRHIFHLISGKVRVYDISQNGDEVEILSYKPPAFFPMSMAINSVHNEYFYTVETAVTLRLAPIEDGLKLLENNIDVTLDLLSRVYKGTDVILRRTTHLMAGSSKNRVLYELVLEGNRSIRNSNGTYRLELSEIGLAARSGLSRETISRVMKDLKSEKLVEIKRNNITVLNLDKLIKVLGHHL